MRPKPPTQLGVAADMVGVVPAVTVALPLMIAVQPVVVLVATTV